MHRKVKGNVTNILVISDGRYLRTSFFLTFWVGYNYFDRRKQNLQLVWLK